MQIRENELWNAIKMIEAFDSADNRGSFTKIFHSGDLINAGIEFEIKEMYYSVSNKNVIRGMHFQLPPYDHSKLVHVMSGRVMDIIVDLRKGSINYGKHIVIELDGNNKRAVWIPKGFAHGFRALEDNTIMQYCVSSVYNKEADSGIRYDSCDIDWGIDNPIVSERDKGFISLDEFESPFRV